MAKPAELPPAPWQRTPTRDRRARRDPITREAIVATALRLLDRDGLDALSMRRVAEELNTGAASLYWHVGSKDGLLDLVFDEVTGELTVPAPDGSRWAEQFKAVARDLRRTLLRHRDIARMSLGRVPMGPNALRYSEKVLAVLRTGGVPDRLAVAGYLLMFAIVNGFTLDETVTGSTVGLAASDTAVPAMVSEYLGALPPEDFPHLVGVAGHFATIDPDAQFELLLDLFVGGLAARVATPRR